MKNKQVSLLLHMYQPPWQHEDILRKINHESYGWLTKLLADNKEYQTTININYSLVELLEHHKLHNIIDNLGRGVEQGNIELTQSAAYHALLPLIPESEMRRQIELNHKKNSEIFKGVWKPKGFFPPEMAVSEEVIRLVNDLGYEWMITEDKVFEAKHKEAIPQNYAGTKNDLSLFFRSSLWSNEFSMNRPARNDYDTKQFINDLEQGIQPNNYLILAFDLETLGHHHPSYNQEAITNLYESIQASNLNLETITNLNDSLEKKPLTKTYEGSWSTNTHDIHQNNPYPLWQDKNNAIHQIQWAITKEVQELVETEKNNPQYHQARDLLDRGLNSCQYWWADQFRWDANNILDASQQLVQAAATLDLDKERLEPLLKKYDSLKEEVKNKDLTN